MKLETAQNIITGKISPKNIKMSKEEMVMLLMGAYLTDEGDVVCLKCNLLNECCSCPS